VFDLFNLPVFSCLDFFFFFFSLPLHKDRPFSFWIPPTRGQVYPLSFPLPWRPFYDFFPVEHGRPFINFFDLYYTASSPLFLWPPVGSLQAGLHPPQSLLCFLRRLQPFFLATPGCLSIQLSFGSNFYIPIFRFDSIRSLFGALRETNVFPRLVSLSRCFL